MNYLLLLYELNIFFKLSKLELNNFFLNEFKLSFPVGSNRLFSLK
nr:MAG TPA: hypothetical protein [Caudoviricetes sp.]